MTLRTLHRFSALVLLAYALLHIGNHLLAVRSVEAHFVAMDLLRHVYRQPVVEAVLLSCVAFQVFSGIRLVVAGWRGRTGRVAWLQALSGMYLALFLAIHVSAVLYGRNVLGLDTNFNFAAAGFHVAPFAWFFAPYYALAVLSLFAHVACAVYWQFHESAPRGARIGLVSILVLGVCASAAITLSLAGMIEPVSIPPAYKAPYGGS